ncbi:MAG: ABC transporter substrate-binding protein [Campylobacteraceae bacterium]|nr:ABC transporter substrate-binding protein [Campylobacteraceae bacterium]
MRKSFKSLSAISLAVALSVGSVFAADVTKSQIDADFNLEKLIEAAKQEGSLTVYDNSSAVKKMAEAFEAKYGIKTTGVKVGTEDALGKIIEEGKSKNVQGDVIAFQDLAALTNILLPEGYVYSWVPADLQKDIDETQQNPLTLVNDPNFWSYNTEVYDSCPISNLWELTDKKWKNKVALEDPESAVKILDWFSQMEQFGEDEMREAYKEHFGKDYKGKSASKEWVDMLAKNNPILTNSNEDISAAVGAPNQKEPPVGLMASSKFRNIETKGYKHGVCEGLKPWVGIAAPKNIVIATNSKNQNAAKLFVHFAMTEEGIKPQIGDGKYSANLSIVQPDDPSNSGKHRENVFFFKSEGASNDWKNREIVKDDWRISHR